MRRGGTVRGFGYDFRLDLVGVVQGDDIFQRRGDQDVALQRQKFVVGDAGRARHADDRARTLLVPQRAQGSMPRGLCTPPRESLIATIFAFFSAKSRATAEPTLPKPRMATVAPRKLIFFTLQASSTTYRTPRPVASVRPSEPPMETGLPVTTPGAACLAEHLTALAAQYAYAGGFEVTIGVENGEALALKTMNPRLGIVGGLSILGTTGIVRPFSCSAYIASIHQGIDVARANGYTHIAACTGNQSEDAMRASLRTAGHRAHRNGRLRRRGAQASAARAGREAEHVRRLRQDQQARGGAHGPAQPQFEHRPAAARRVGRRARARTRRLQDAIRAANTSQEALALARAQGVALGDIVCARARRRGARRGAAKASTWRCSRSTGKGASSEPRHEARAAARRHRRRARHRAASRPRARVQSRGTRPRARRSRVRGACGRFWRQRRGLRTFIEAQGIGLDRRRDASVRRANEPSCSCEASALDERAMLGDPACRVAAASRRRLARCRRLERHRRAHRAVSSGRSGRSGREPLAHLDEIPPSQHWTIRCLDPHPGHARATIIAARGPFSLEGERALFDAQRTDVVISKNSGGAATEAKLAVARERGVPVVMLQRPALAAVEREFDDTASALRSTRSTGCIPHPLFDKTP